MAFWERLGFFVVGIAFLAQPGYAAPKPSPSPLGIRAVTVEVLPLQVPPGLSLPAPAADRVEAPPYWRTFRAAPRAGSAIQRPVKPSPTPSVRGVHH